MKFAIGAQLWVFNSVGDEGEMAAILAGLASAGYTCLETLYDNPPRQSEALTQFNLACYATHAALDGLPEDALLLQNLELLGTNKVCVSGLLRWHERSADDYLRSADALNERATRLLKHGITLNYHNHDFEFAPLEQERTGMDLLLERLDPRLVPLCVDAGWIALAGAEPASFLLANAARVNTVHLRDFRGTTSVALGQGDIALHGVIDTLPHLPNLEAVLVEQDPGTATPLQDMCASRAFLLDTYQL